MGESTTWTAMAGIGFDDFEIFARSFGNTVNRAPVFTSTPVTRSIAENTPAGEPVGDPLSARDADGNTLTYRLRGADADSFAIDAGTGQIRTKGTYDFEAQSSYSVIARVSDGEGGARQSLSSASPSPTSPNHLLRRPRVWWSRLATAH